MGIGERQRFSTNGPMQSTVCPTAILHLCKLSLLHIGGEKARKCTPRDPRHAGRLSYKDRRRRRGRVSDLSLAPPMTHFGSSSWEINRGAYSRTRLPKEKGDYPEFWTLGATIYSSNFSRVGGDGGRTDLNAESWKFGERATMPCQPLLH